ncbi:MAG: heme-binding domain-containing protein [Epsilonproteobacteria bacterium]|nr:heme-binding domain-containing protein [Campylobacterota bacterium]MCL5272209.1 heme-binding domain-containing protein [Gammaproteobacteria bacterium]
MKTKILAGFAIAAIAIQFIPYGNDHTNPPVVSEPTWDSPRTKELFNNACADCHSHQTKYPWYSNIAPISWLIAHDVEEGREHFNVSTWGAQKKNEGDEAAKEVREGEMPLWFYLPTHPEAKLSDTQKQELMSGLEKTFGKEEAEEEKK